MLRCFSDILPFGGWLQKKKALNYNYINILYDIIIHSNLLSMFIIIWSTPLSYINKAQSDARHHHHEKLSFPKH